MTTDAKNFQFLFQLERIKIDSRDFRQDSDSFVPVGHSLWIEILMPRENEYIANLSEISIAELSSNENPPAPVLTPKGYAYIKKALEMGFDSPNLKETLPENEGDDWGNTVDTEKSLNPEKVASKDDWDKSPFEANKVKSESWEDEKEW